MLYNMPFLSEREARLYKNIMNGHFDIHEPYYGNHKKHRKPKKQRKGRGKSK